MKINIDDEHYLGNLYLSTGLKGAGHYTARGV